MKITLDAPYFKCPDNIRPHLQRVFDGEYEIPLIYSHTQPTILDLGANFGSFSVWASHRWPGCRIHAYEPNPKTFSQLKENLLLYNNVTAYECGVGNPGMRPLSNGLTNDGECSFHQVENNPYPTGQHCEVIDPLTMPEAHILKMDIEGCEVEVLAPLLAAGRKFNAIMYEYHNRRLRLEMEDLLRADYILANSMNYSPDLGVVAFMHKECLT